MKTKTNQPVFLDNGELVNDSSLGGTQLYKHVLGSIKATYQGDPLDNWNFTIISTSSTKVSSTAQLSNLINSALILKIHDDVFNELIVAGEINYFFVKNSDFTIVKYDKLDIFLTWDNELSFSSVTPL